MKHRHWDARTLLPVMYLRQTAKKACPVGGLEFLHSVCVAVDIAVYGIGGIDVDNIALVRNAGASGACLMSSLMATKDVAGLLKAMEG